ncbi:MAG: hypothetical protein HY819_21800 [Acidobacteria bacterium]|nr:hypothetical protein [Acidobacteriota bacterium]
MNSNNQSIAAFAESINTKKHSGKLSESKAEEFLDFLQEVNQEFLQHSIVTNNLYTYWFQQGGFSLKHLRHFTVQFSVFSNQFLVAQLKKMINADSLEAMRSAKEILANEIGVVFYNKAKKKQKLNAEEIEKEGDPELVSISGSIDGGTFRFTAAHFEWLLSFAKPLGLGFGDMGKLSYATDSTKFFCEELCRIYASEDANIAAGASFAIENWAAAGFWQQLVDGLTIFKKTQVPELHLAFFTWHNRLEAQHAHSTLKELEEIFFKPNFDKEKFLIGGIAMLNALSIFWNGMFED